MNSYRTSDGNRVTQNTIDREVSKAKHAFMQASIGKHIVCQECFRNDCTPVDISHTISVKHAKETGRTELAWDHERNFKWRGRRCHLAFDDKTNMERELIFNKINNL